MGRVLAHAAGLAPFLRLLWLGTHAGLTADPVAFVQHQTGDWALNFLIVTLALRPLGQIRYRRAAGLYAFFYACLHFLVWLWLDKEFNLAEMLEDVYARAWILAGFSSLVLMVPLAITSTKGWIRRLGKRWAQLHSLVYPAAALGGIHYLLQVKLDRRWPLLYLYVILALLGWRVIKRLHNPWRANNLDSARR